MSTQISSITTICLSLLLVIQSNAVLVEDNTLTNSVISNYRIVPRDASPVEEGPLLIKYLGFVTKDSPQHNDSVHSVELHPNDDFALAKCSSKAMLYELLNFQLQLYLTIEKTSFRPKLLPVCERVEKCIGSMYSFASTSDTLRERLFSPIFLVLKQAIGMACNLERKESKMNINSIVDQTQTAYNQLMVLKNLLKTVVDIGLF